MVGSIVITAINPRTPCIDKIENILPKWKILLIGDVKSHVINSSANLNFFSIEDQEKLPFLLWENFLVIIIVGKYWLSFVFI